MTDHDVIEETESLRVRLVPDISPDEPYDDGGSPLIRIDYRSTWDTYRAEQVTGITSYRAHDALVSAAARWHREPELFERYARIFHGVTKVETWHSGEAWYLACDPADWRELMGLTDEYLVAHPDVVTTDMTEWRAYCEGDVWGYVLEERAHWVREGTDEERNTWEQVDSCFGFYGYDYALESAREAMAA